MEEKRFVTLIRADHKLGGNKYVQGRVTGMAYIICEVYKKIPHGLGENKDGVIHVLYCTEEQYERFAKIAEESYPGLCIFNYEEPK